MVFMNLHHVLFEALYEIKLTRRNLLFNMFVFFALLTTISFTFISFSESDKIEFGKFYLPWFAQALPSSIPFMTAYYYNFVQVLMAFFMVSNDLRRLRLTTISALEARPQNNSDAIIGKFLGRVAIFSLVNVLIYSVMICYNLIYYPRVLNISYYFFYWITLNFPVLIYFLSLSILVSRFVNNQGISILILLFFCVGTTICGAGVMNNLFDPFARYIPNLFSDFVGHTQLKCFLLHQTIYLLMGICLLVLSILVYRRLPNNIHQVRNVLGFAMFPLILSIVLIAYYIGDFVHIERDKNEYRQFYLEYEHVLKNRVLSNEIRLRDLGKKGVAVESKMKIVNKNEEQIPVLLYLNPGLTVNGIKNGSVNLSFERKGPVILVNKQLAAGDTCDLVVNYEGIVDNDVCHLDRSVVPGYQRLNENRCGIYSFGTQPAYCVNNYKLFTPEVLWYPTCVPPTCFSFFRNMDFTYFSLVVIHDEQNTAISQGEIINEQIGITIFKHEHAISGISLCVGKYDKRVVMMDSIPVEIYYEPSHGYLLDSFRIDVDVLEEHLLNFKSKLEKRNMSSYIDTETKRLKYNYSTALKSDLEYPYSWLRFIETPLDFYPFPKPDAMDGERVQNGLIFLTEKLCNQHFIDGEYNPGLRKYGSEWHFKMLLDSNLTHGGCNIKSMLQNEFNYVSSVDYPMINEILINMLSRYSFGLMQSFEPMDEYRAMDYLSRYCLREAIHDLNLSSKELYFIIKKKGWELYSLICTRVSKDEFDDFLYGFFSKYRFMNVELKIFSKNLMEQCGVDLDHILPDLYNSSRLPVFKVDAECYQVGDLIDSWQANQYFLFKIYNMCDVPGVIMTRPGGFYLIPGHSCKEIIVNDTTSSSLSYRIEMPMSRNIPSVKRYRAKKVVYNELGLKEGIRDIDSMYFQDNSPDIIVDNVNERCKIIETKTWLQDVLEKYNVDIPFLSERKKNRNQWLIGFNTKFYGFPVQSAYYKEAGTGDKRVEWTIDITHPGKYELFFHNVDGTRHEKSLDDKTLYFSVYNGEDTFDLKINIDSESDEWVSLGKYDVFNCIKVVQYDKQELLSIFSFKGLNKVFVDAIKMKKIRR